MSSIDHIRNFSIIAHIDHGKSTIADRIIQKCGGLSEREMKDQVLDSMDIERERGITIKAQTVRLSYKSRDGKEYILNIIDTPGHVDFSYEVSRSLYACEGSILIVDSSQGVEAQTLANVYQALDIEHEIVPVLNKIDLPASDIEKTTKQIEDVIGIETTNSVPCSGKTGEGVEEILEKIVKILPPPKGIKNELLKCLLVDSWYDSYLGVVILVRVIDGYIKKNMKIKMMSNNQEYEVERVGVFTPKPKDVNELGAGEIGFIITGIKNLSETKVGDTICDSLKPLKEALPGFKPSKPVVFCGLFPVDSSEYQKLKDGLAKLQLNDASFSFEAESSSALGLGFRCGFLGLLHLEIISQRLEREFDINLLTTTPGVVYKVHLNNGKIIDLQNPSTLPDPTHIKLIEEPEPPVLPKSSHNKPSQLIGLQISGNKILIALDTSASMAHIKLVEIISSIADASGQRLEKGLKWKQAKEIVRWLIEQAPQSSSIRTIGYSDSITFSDSSWNKTKDALEIYNSKIEAIIPRNGTSLAVALEHIKSSSYQPSDIYLITDGLPTLSGKNSPLFTLNQMVKGCFQSKKSNTFVSGNCRKMLFQSAVSDFQKESHSRVHVILLPLEGDPEAAHLYQHWTNLSGGTVLSPAASWLK